MYNNGDKKTALSCEQYSPSLRFVICIIHLIHACTFIHTNIHTGSCLLRTYCCCCCCKNLTQRPVRRKRRGNSLCVTFSLGVRAAATSKCVLQTLQQQQRIVGGPERTAAHIAYISLLVCFLANVRTTRTVHKQTWIM